MAQRDFVTSADWTLESLLAMGPRFRPVSRIAISDPDLDTYLLDYERTDIPMVIEGLEKHPKWPSEMFDIQWFLQHGPQDLQARNVYDRTDVPISLSDFIAKSRSAGPRASPDEYERLYAKDVECPSRWESWLGEGAVIPPLLCPEGPADIMKHLPQPERVENLMCYLGIGDTFTPCHKDLCASSGHNLMCYTEGSASAFWFMTDGAAAPAAAAYFQSLDQELDWENHTISLDELANAPFEVYITEQKVGDFVLVPPRSCHQVVNHGGLTVKMSWSRMTLRGVGVALHHELPIYRRVCRPETYRIKSTIHHTLLHHTAQLENASMSEDTASEDMNSSEVDPLRIALELERLLELFQEIMVDEYHPRPDSLRRIVTTFNHEAHTSGRYEAYTCDFCGSDIFLSFFLCQSCAPPSPLDSMSPGPADGIHICPGCYSEGRTCRCRSMTPVQSWPVEVLVDDYNRAVRALRALGAEEWEELLGLGELRSEEYIGLFEAADAVRRMRTNAKPGDSRCHAIKHGHTKPAAESLNCKRCHHSRCFVHLAGIGIHSSQAVVAHQKSTDHRYWHNLHRSLRDSFVRNKPNILAAEMSGDGFSNLMGHRLAIAATTFPHCQPVDILNTRHGWYDQALPNLSIPSLSIRIPPTHIRPSDDSMDVSPKSPDWNWQSNDLSPDDEEGLSPLSSIDATSDNVTVVQDAQPSLPPPRKEHTSSRNHASKTKPPQAGPQPSADSTESIRRKRKAATFDGVSLPMPSERKRKIVSKSTENASRTIITAQPMSPNKLDEKRELKPDNDHATQAGDSSNQKDVSEEIRLLRILMKKSEKTLFDAIMRMEKSQYSAIHRLERHIETLENSVDNLPSTLSRYIEDDESSPEHRESTPAASPVHTIQTAKGTYPEGDSQWQQPPTPTSYAPSPQGDQAQGHYRNYQQQQQQGYYQPGYHKQWNNNRGRPYNHRGRGRGGYYNNRGGYKQYHNYTNQDFYGYSQGPSYPPPMPMDPNQMPLAPPPPPPQQHQAPPTPQSAAPHSQAFDGPSKPLAKKKRLLHERIQSEYAPPREQYAEYATDGEGYAQRGESASSQERDERSYAPPTRKPARALKRAYSPGA